MFGITYYWGVALLGFLHGLEPAHGWPVALLYAMRKPAPQLAALAAAGLIALAHFTSSIAVAAAYLLLRRWFDISLPYLKYVAAALLLILAYFAFREKPEGLAKQHGHLHKNEPETEHEHEHTHGGMKHTHRHRHEVGTALSLLGIAAFAFILGFAHEEEFALLALVTQGADAWLLMGAYGLAVGTAIIGVTVLSTQVYERLQPRLNRYEGYIPKMSAAILVLLAVFILIQ